MQQWHQQCAPPTSRQHRGKELSFHSDKSPGSRLGRVSKRIFPFLWFPANTFPAPEFGGCLAPLQAEPPEPQVEEESGGLCQMEINPENPSATGSGGKGFQLLLRAYIWHRCLGAPAGPALSHSWWLVSVCHLPYSIALRYAPDDTEF